MRISEDISRRNPLTGALMIFSIVLLIVLQVLWLAASWREAREDFRKETNGLFRHTIFAMQDSMLFRNTTPVPGDPPFFTPKFFSDSLRSSADRDLFVDRIRRRDSSSVMEVFITKNDKDSVEHLIPQLARRMRMDRRNSKFIVHLGPDSLNTDSIQAKFRETLSSAGLQVSFNVIQMRKSRPGRTLPPPPLDGVVVSEWVPFNPVRYYAVQFAS
ncbi:MAG TPA: hypothetical protein VFT90_17875, partial [Chryseosolibacter sp.]|nr:hypothetical protein [Chryseosolibacter sp.]